MSDPVIESRDVAVDGSRYHVAVSLAGVAYLPRWSCKICDGDSYRQEAHCDTCQQAVAAAMIALHRHHDENHSLESSCRAVRQLQH